MAPPEIEATGHIPFAAEKRPDTGVTNGQLGIWLFLASELMLFGSLFSAYALLRTGAAAWPDQSSIVSVPLGALNTVVLLVSSATIARARTAAGASRTLLGVTVVLGLAFLGIKGIEYADKLGQGLAPASSNFLGLYFVLTGLHGLHLLAGIGAAAYLWGPGRRLHETDPRRFAQRVSITAIYWHFVDALWIVIFVVLYLL